MKRIKLLLRQTCCCLNDISNDIMGEFRDVHRGQGGGGGGGGPMFLSFLGFL